MPEKLKKFLETVSDDEAATLWIWFERNTDASLEVQEMLEKSHYVLAHPPGQTSFPVA